MSILGFFRKLFNIQPQVRYIKAAQKNREFSNWILNRDTPNADLNQYETVRVRANDLYINNVFIRGAVDMLVNKIVGAGSTPQARSDDPNFNAEAEAGFRRWSEVADVYGQFHFGDIERLLIQRLFLDGGVFVKKILDNKRKNPYCLQILEYSSLADQGTPKGNNQIVHGVEVDPNGIVVAYHFNVGSDLGLSSKIVRISKNNILHFSPFRRPGQLLGIPLLAPAIPAAYNLNEIIEAELISKRVEASLSVFIKTNDVYGKLQGLQKNDNNDREIEIAPGMVNFLEPGEDITTVDPQRPGKNFREFTYLILEGIARSLGMSLEQITGDKSQVNYSSARHSELELRDYIRPFRKALERYFLIPVWRDYINFAVMSGQLKVKGYMQNPEKYEKVEWIFKGDDWVDPLKEIDAKTNEILLGVSTLSDVCAAKGKDWQEVLKQRAREVEFIKKLGLTDISQDNVKLVNRTLEVIDGHKAE